MTTKAIALHRPHGHHHSTHHLPVWELWVIRHKRWVLVAAAAMVAAALASIAWQLVYPSNRALPVMYIGGIDVGGKDRDALVAQLSEYAQQGEVTIKSPSRSWQAKWQSIGITIDAEASADVALSYGAWERLIPFSGFIKIQQGGSTPLVALIDEDRLRAFATTLVQEDQQAASNATITIKDGEVVIDNAKNGYIFKQEDVERQVRAAAVAANAQLTLVPEQVPFVRSAAELSRISQQATAVLGHKVTLRIHDKTFSPTAAQIGTWLRFAEDAESHDLQLAFNHDAMRTYLGSIDADIKITPGTSTVTLLDGQEISRTPAASGRTVAVDESLAAIEVALLGSDTTPVVELNIKDVPPQLDYVRTYSSTSNGILAIIQDWNAAYYGDFGVVVRELGGQGRYAEFDADKPFVPASTFKLFTYLAVQDGIQKGLISYNTMTDRGWTVEACIEEMIVRSTNPCAISLLNLVGWQHAQDIVSAAGFAATNINNQGGGDKYTTVRDEANYLMRLYHGTLMGQEATDRLLGYMKRQIWRAGIPSGVPWGVTVADKVGFYNSWVHDVAIVYGPNSTYILAIMSRGGSDAAFGELSRRIYRFFNG